MMIAAAKRCNGFFVGRNDHICRKARTPKNAGNKRVKKTNLRQFAEVVSLKEIFQKESRRSKAAAAHKVDSYQ